MPHQVQQARVSYEETTENQQICQQSQDRINQLEKETQQANAKINQLDAAIQELIHKESGTVDCKTILSGIGGKLSESVSVKFKQPYNKPPVVHIGLTSMDATTVSTIRATAHVLHVDATGFSVQCSTLGDNVLYSLKANWVSLAN